MSIIIFRSHLTSFTTKKGKKKTKLSPSSAQKIYRKGLRLIWLESSPHFASNRVLCWNNSGHLFIPGREQGWGVGKEQVRKLINSPFYYYVTVIEELFPKRSRQRGKMVSGLKKPGAIDLHNIWTRTPSIWLWHPLHDSIKYEAGFHCFIHGYLDFPNETIISLGKGTKFILDIFIHLVNSCWNYVQPTFVTIL